MFYKEERCDRGKVVGMEGSVSEDMLTTSARKRVSEEF